MFSLFQDLLLYKYTEKTKQLVPSLHRHHFHTDYIFVIRIKNCILTQFPSHGHFKGSRFSDTSCVKFALIVFETLWSLLTCSNSWFYFLAASMKMTEFKQRPDNYHPGIMLLLHLPHCGIVAVGSIYTAVPESLYNTSNQLAAVVESLRGALGLGLEGFWPITTIITFSY